MIKSNVRHVDIPARLGSHVASRSDRRAGTELAGISDHSDASSLTVDENMKIEGHRR